MNVSPNKLQDMNTTMTSSRTIYNLKKFTDYAINIQTIVLFRISGVNQGFIIGTLNLPNTKTWCNHSY